MADNIVTFDDYERAAMRTAGKMDLTSQLVAGAMGLCGEAGETCDYLKKVVFHGHRLDCDKLAEELGDQLWYIALLADAIGISMQQIARRNIAKLQRRYPKGFDPERSMHRDGTVVTRTDCRWWSASKPGCVLYIAEGCPECRRYERSVEPA